MIYQTVILAIVAYFLGSISFSYIFTKRRTGKDIRTVGGKNSGALNVFENMGKEIGLLAGISDALKAVVVVIGKLIGLDTFPTIFAASFAVIGHYFRSTTNFMVAEELLTLLGFSMLYSAQSISQLYFNGSYCLLYPQNELHSFVYPRLFSYYGCYFQKTSYNHLGSCISRSLNRGYQPYHQYLKKR
ncbi:MAG: glycerol-3-phosphate acyltransferase [Candidatus Marinimicrobia bacterium]|nr:glycerol-3-phosphate acyltransferase [Candidatus Neomarinimicrobiota bacterium]